MLKDAIEIRKRVVEKTNTVYYSDELNDDFARTKIDTKKPDSRFRYRHRGFLWNFFAFLIYRLLAVPFAYLFCRIGFGLRIENRQILKPYLKAGFFLYGNHTQTVADAFLPTLVASPKKAFLIANPDVVSIPGLRQIVQMLGAIPIAGTLGGMKNMMDTLERRNRSGGCIAVYPEAHIWPYYTGIRPFRSNSFAFPVKFGAPCFSFTTTYQRRENSFSLFDLPQITVHVDGPFFPDRSLEKNAAKEKLRDEIYASMTKNAQTFNQVEYVRYRKVPPNLETEDDFLVRANN